MLNFRTYFLICAVALLFNACKDDPFILGGEWAETKFRTILVDTITPQLTTVRNDSLLTLNRNAILVGKYADPFMGVVTAHSYTEIAVPSNSNLPDEAIYDSLILEFRLKAKYYGDTTQLFEINVHKITEEMTLEDNKYYYNTSKLKVDPTVLGKLTFTPEPSDVADNLGNKKNNYKIKITDQLGLDLFNKLQSESDTIKNAELFIDYLNGLAFFPGNNNKVVLSILTDTTFKLRLHYHVDEDYSSTNHIDFPINASKQFNNIKADRTGTILAPFNDNKLHSKTELLSSETNNMSFIQSGDGMYMRIDFPSLNTLQESGKYGAIEQASLIIRPIEESYSLLRNFAPLPPTLTLFAVNEQGLQTALSTSNNQQQTGNLYIDNVYGKETRYIYDVTAFLRSQLGAFDNDKGFLKLSIIDGDLRNSVQRAIFGADGHKNQIELKIYYTLYDENKN